MRKRIIDKNKIIVCPFHIGERPPLFIEDGYYHCMSCGKEGYIVDLKSKGLYHEKRQSI
jgi:hypothetical protein